MQKHIFHNNNLKSNIEVHFVSLEGLLTTTVIESPRAVLKLTTNLIRRKYSGRKK